MSRAKSKVAIIHDMQGKLPDVILTKKDCDMIAKALCETFKFDDIHGLYMYLKKLTASN